MNMGVALGFFGILFMAVTGRIVMAQAMISGVATTDQRGSFMSVNGSVQHLGQGLASMVAGVIIHTDRVTHRMNNYNWVGYLSVSVLIISLFIGQHVFKSVDKAAER
jgi:DHA1 family inner membrane transport protein